MAGRRKKQNNLTLEEQLESRTRTNQEEEKRQLGRPPARKASM